MLLFSVWCVACAEVLGNLKIRGTNSMVSLFLIFTKCVFVYVCTWINDMAY